MTGRDNAVCWQGLCRIDSYGIGVYSVATAGGWYGYSGLWKAAVLAVALLSGALLYFFSAYLLKVYEMRFLGA